MSREEILASIDWIVFGFIKAFRQGNGKSVPRIGEFFDCRAQPQRTNRGRTTPERLALERVAGTACR